MIFDFSESESSIRTTKNLIQTIFRVINCDSWGVNEFRAFMILENGVVCGVPKDTNYFTLQELDEDLYPYRSLGVSISKANSIVKFNDNPLNKNYRIAAIISRRDDIVDNCEINIELVNLIDDPKNIISEVI